MKKTGILLLIFLLISIVSIPAAAEETVQTTITGENLQLTVNGIDTSDPRQLLSICIVRSAALSQPANTDIVYANTVYTNGRDTLQMDISLGDINVYDYHLIIRDKTGSLTYSQPLATRTPLTITGVSLEEKTYDGSNKGFVNSVTFAQTDSLKFGVDYTADVVYESKDAGACSATVTVTLLDTDTAKMYTIPQPVFVAQDQYISLKDLHISVQIADKQYDGLAAATIKKAELIDVVEGDVVTLNSEGVKANFDSVAVGENIGVTLTGSFVLEGEDAKNYRLIPPDELKASIYAVAPTGETETGNTTKSSSETSIPEESTTVPETTPQTGYSRSLGRWFAVSALAILAVAATMTVCKKKEKTTK